MNNYLSLNLVSGKLSKFAGGGKPKFVLNENNAVQLYVLDFPNPSTYPTASLGDAFGELTTRNFNSTPITINIGKRGDSKIISSSTLSNLPNNFDVAAKTLVTTTTSGDRSRVSFSGTISVSPIPEQSSLFSLTVVGSGIERWGGTSFTRTQKSPFFSFDTSFSNIEGIFLQSIAYCASETLDAAISNFVGCTRLDFYNKVIQNSDYSYSFEYTYETCSSTPTSSLGLSISIDSSKASPNYGKYGYLDFSSPSWDSIIGTKNEAPIWIEAMIGGDTVAQGYAIICKKMT